MTHWKWIKLMKGKWATKNVWNIYEIHELDRDGHWTRPVLRAFSVRNGQLVPFNLTWFPLFKLQRSTFGPSLPSKIWNINMNWFCFISFHFIFVDFVVSPNCSQRCIVKHLLKWRFQSLFVYCFPSNLLARLTDNIENPIKWHVRHRLLKRK